MPHAGHAVAGELVHFVGGEEGQLRVEDRVEVGVLRRLAAEGVHQDLRLVQVVPHGRQPVQVPLEVRAQRVDAVVDVAVVVVEDVLAPVGWAAVVLAAVVGLVDFVGVVPVHGAVAAVEVHGGRHRHDHVVANLLDEGLFRHRKAIDQFDHGFGGGRLGAVQARRHVVVRLGRGENLLRLGWREAARVGQPADVLAVGLEVLQVGFGGDEHHLDVTTFLRSPGRHGAHAPRQRLLEGFEIGLLLAGGGEALGLADVIPQYVLGAGHALAPRQVRDERAGELRPGRPFLHPRGKIVVGRRRRRAGLPIGHRPKSEDQCKRGPDPYAQSGREWRNHVHQVLLNLPFR